MNADKMYIPDPQKWYRNYQNSMKGKSNAYITHLQNGGTDTFMIPLDKRAFTTNDKKKDKVEIRLVAPSQQVVNMAKEELENEQTIKSRKRKKHVIQTQNLQGGKKSKPSKSKNTKSDIFVK